MYRRDAKPDATISTQNSDTRWKAQEHIHESWILSHRNQRSKVGLQIRTREEVTGTVYKDLSLAGTVVYISSDAATWAPCGFPAQERRQLCRRARCKSANQDARVRQRLHRRLHEMPLMPAFASAVGEDYDQLFSSST